MGQLVANNAMCACAFGAGPAPLKVLPAKQVLADKQPAATIQDFAPNTNIGPFIMCISPSNPQVAAATAAALGVLTPQPCIPVTVAPWAPGSPTVMIGNAPALTADSMCNCAWGGVITISFAGTTDVMVSG